MADEAEIARLKAKLKKANANHQEMVSTWAEQSSELENEVPATRSFWMREDSIRFFEDSNIF